MKISGLPLFIATLILSQLTLCDGTAETAVLVSSEEFSIPSTSPLLRGYMANSQIILLKGFTDLFAIQSSKPYYEYFLLPQDGNSKEIQEINTDLLSHTEIQGQLREQV